MLAAGVARAPSARALRRHVFSVGTCSPSARVLRAHTYRELLRALLKTSLSLLFLSFTHTARPFRALFPHGLDCSTSAQLRVAPPSWRAASVSPPIGRQTRPLPSASLVTVTGGFLHPLGDVLRFFSLAPNHPKTFLCLEFWRETPADEEARHGSRG